MKKNIKYKLLVFIITILLLLNTSSTFAFSMIRNNFRRSNVETNSQEQVTQQGRSLGNYLRNFISENQKRREESLNQYQEIIKKQEEARQKRQQDLEKRIEESSRVKQIEIPSYNEVTEKSKNDLQEHENEIEENIRVNRNIGTSSFLRELFTRTQAYREEVAKKRAEFLAQDILGSYIYSKEDVEMIADVISSIKALNIDEDKIRVALSQFLKALVYSTSALPTAEDYIELKNIIDNHIYYYIDTDENGLAISDDVEVTYSTLQDMARLCNYGTIGYERGENRPISIGKVKLHIEDTNNNTAEDIDDVYYVGLAGTRFIQEQSCGLIADVLSGIETNSPYLQNATKAITENIPKGSKIMLSGFSLGGMMAQQLLVQEEIISNYEIVQVSLLGCPPLCVDERAELFNKYNLNIPINRVIDEYDLIPFMCVDWFLDEEPKEIIENLYVENHNNTRLYKTYLGTHILGYVEQDCYKKYDVLENNTENGVYHSITFKHGDFQYYEAPTKFLHGYISKYE